uniref:Uncharacterized protein n=1 Tax=uncultured marine group II/III euryarchaeote KM3_158_C07 TaxID=1457906 RepID=A0A075GLQ7_9EURY|nr:hypothetical protein [uncultured marine group II/III euryarchaeote KM3_158_C07]
MIAYTLEDIELHVAYVLDEGYRIKVPLEPTTNIVVWSENRVELDEVRLNSIFQVLFQRFCWELLVELVVDQLCEVK